MTEEERLNALDALDKAVRMQDFTDQGTYCEALLETYLFHKDDFPMFIDVRQIPAGSRSPVAFYKRVTVSADPLTPKTIRADELAVVDIERFECRIRNAPFAHGVVGFNLAERLFVIGIGG